MTSPVTKNDCPSANRYHGTLYAGLWSLIPTRIATTEDAPNRLKIGPMLKAAGPNRYMAARQAPPTRYGIQARWRMPFYRPVRSGPYPERGTRSHGSPQVGGPRDARSSHPSVRPMPES